ncbi:MAG TPA: MAPEG family protein [Burkholderiaceae bacterium]|nr:MAPEG family protein [Burkholderiaceae bacterium]HMY99484.1 MAPEG family protein [Burkholderiaceae bacterium]HNB44033.1 MAPEG family protein [Burkholderiaceae bacterium]HNG79227.1 MAPEG family protein [Burkholderiaceae bacterium]
MSVIHLVALLALLQYLFFGALVGQARVRHGVEAPAVTGHPLFERMYRVQMNTLELLVVFLPALWLAALYWSPLGMGALGAVYLVGRLIYWRAYTRDPVSRSLGFTLSFLPIVLLLLAGLGGAVMALPQ